MNYWTCWWVVVVMVTTGATDAADFSPCLIWRVLGLMDGWGGFKGLPRDREDEDQEGNKERIGECRWETIKEKVVSNFGFRTYFDGEDVWVLRKRGETRVGSWAGDMAVDNSCRR